MPQRKSIKNVIVECIVFLGLLATLGHMTVNFWEKFMIQSELVHVKTSLHSLKETITTIGAAYDSLHKELRNIIEIAGKRNPRLKNFEYKTDPILAKHDKTTEKKHLIEKMENTIGVGNTNVDPIKNDRGENYSFIEPQENKKSESLVNTKPLNAATKTSNPIKPVEVKNPYKNPTEYKRRNMYSQPHKCLYLPEYCHHRNQNDYPYHNWRV